MKIEEKDAIKELEEFYGELYDTISEYQNIVRNLNSEEVEDILDLEDSTGFSEEQLRKIGDLLEDKEVIGRYESVHGGERGYSNTYRRTDIPRDTEYALEHLDNKNGKDRFVTAMVHLNE